jgi:uncharacterized membrane protein YhaH (DUF805 family)
MDWKYLFGSFDGRIGRQTFWIGVVTLMIASAVLHLVLAALFGWHHAMGGPINGAVSLILLYPSLAVDVKRLHDRDKSGWWILLLLVPVLGFIWFIVECGCLRGTAGPNRFGPDPLPAQSPAV